MDMQFFIIIAGAVGIFLLIAIAFMGPSTNKASSRRLGAVKLRHSDSESTKVEAQMKRAIAARKPIMQGEGVTISRSDKLRLRLAQTGKTWTLKQYLTVSLSVFAFLFLLLAIRGAPLYLAFCVGALIGLGVPHFVVGYLIKKRVNDFTVNFPDAIELLVRGLKSGLPVSETLNVIAREVPGPVGEEFKIVTEKIKIGKTMEDALQEAADRMGTPEFQFFTITLAIQRETGGNLAETLGNLADVLRGRAKMKLKIKAMSSESKASAYIIGALPFMVFGMIYYVNPSYMLGFFSDDRLIIAGLGGACWMGIGVFIMSKMISFEI